MKKLKAILLALVVGLAAFGGVGHAEGGSMYIPIGCDGGSEYGWDGESSWSGGIFRGGHIRVIGGC